MLRKILKKIGLLIMAFVLINIIYYYLKPAGVKQFVLNKDLETIQKDWKGNIKMRQGNLAGNGFSRQKG
jgi:cbb3-type cytochrome oxidase subunit 3